MAPAPTDEATEASNSQEASQATTDASTANSPDPSEYMPFETPTLASTMPPTERHDEHTTNYHSRTTRT